MTLFSPPALRPTGLPATLVYYSLVCAMTAAIGGCADPAATQTRSLDRPVDLASFCVTTALGEDRRWTVSPAPDCSGNGLWAFVTNAKFGDIGVLNLRAAEEAQRNVDTDPFIPGYTRIAVGGVLGVTARSEAGRYLYFTRIDEEGGPSIDRLLVGAWSQPPLRQALPSAAADLIWLPGSTPSSGRLAVALPDTGSVAIIEIDEDSSGPTGFGQLDVSEVKVWPVGGIPASLAYAPPAGERPARLFVGQQQAAWLGVLDGETGELVARLSLGPQCQDGLDNDGDGLVDGADWACTDYDINDESAEIHSTAACWDGIDNDGDGFTDFPDDPGCISPFDDSENSENPACADGIDNDGDGLTDYPEDPDCTPDGQTEGPLICGANEQLPCPDPQGSPLPECGNGIDDDGDGLTDADDPECLTRADVSEGGATSPAVSYIALSPSGRALYATHAGRREIFVFDVDTLSSIDVQRRSAPLGNPLLALEGVRGISLPRSPLALAFANTVTLAQRLDATGPASTNQVDSETAFITTTAGELYLVDATADGAAYHLPRVTVAQANTATRPQLFVAGNEVEQAFRPAEGQPHLGPFTEDRANFLYNGITVSQDTRIVRGEDWTLTHQGPLPQSRRSTGEIKGWRRAPDGAMEAIFHDPFADFCRLGVEPGDTLVLLPGFRLQCEAESGAVMGDRLEYRIASVSADSLALRGADFRPHCPAQAQGATSSLAAAGGVGIRVATDAERLEQNLLPTTLGDQCTALPLPTASCLPGRLTYEVAVPPDHWTVVGSRTGFVHPWENRSGQCTRRMSDSRAQGRAKQSVPGDMPPDTCGQFPLPSSLFSEEWPFENFSVRFTLRPGCFPGSETLTGGTIPARFNPVSRGTALRFTLRAGANPQARVVGAVPGRLRFDPVDNRLYIIDQGRSTVLGLDATRIDLPTISTYF